MPRPTTRREGQHRSSTLPWVTVAAGGGAIVVLLSIAGAVGAATVTSQSVAVPDGAGEDWASELDLGTPGVTPGSEPVDGDPSGLPPVPEPPESIDTTSPDTPDPAPEPSEPVTPAPTATTPSEPDVPPAESDEPDEPSPTTSEPEVTEPSQTPTEQPEPVSPEEPDLTEPIEPGDSGPAVEWVQERLRAHGADVTVTGTLDATTVRAVRDFQAAHGLEPTGTVSGATTDALAAPPSAGATGPSDGASDSASEGAAGERLPPAPEDGSADRSEQDAVG